MCLTVSTQCDVIMTSPEFLWDELDQLIIDKATKQWRTRL